MTFALLMEWVNSLVRGGVVMAKSLVPDELWEIIQPLLPLAKPRRFRYLACGCPTNCCHLGKQRDG